MLFIILRAVGVRIRALPDMQSMPQEYYVCVSWCLVRYGTVDFPCLGSSHTSRLDNSTRVENKTPQGSGGGRWYAQQ